MHMPQSPEFSPVESIRRTLEVYDPNHRSLLVGTAALHWVLASRGIDSSSLPLRDVDALVTEDAFDEIHQGLMRGTYSQVKKRDHRLTITPSEDRAKWGVIPFDMMSDNDSYDEPMVLTKFRKRVYVKDMDHAGQICETDRVRHLDLPFIFWWKSSVGRDTDIDTLHKTIKLLYEKGQWGWGEPHNLMTAMERGDQGLNFAGHFIWSDDPAELLEEERQYRETGRINGVEIK